MGQNKIGVDHSETINADVIQTPTTTSRTLYECFRKRKTAWIIFFIIVAILIIIIPTIITTTKNINITKSTTETISPTIMTDTEESTIEVTTTISTTIMTDAKESTIAVTTTTTAISTMATTEKVKLTTKEQVLFSMNITDNTVWIQNGATVAGGNGQGNQLNQLSSPRGIYINDNDQTIYIADFGNHRIIEWKYGAKNGQIVADGNQLNSPVDVFFDRKNNALIICDQGNRRVVRLSLQNPAYQQLIISDIYCCDLTMDNNGSLYVSDCEKHEVRQWRNGEINGTIVAGGNGIGNHATQLNFPTYIFIDEDYSLYVSDSDNSRVMKWMKRAKQGMIVAGRQGQGNLLTQFLHPREVIVDHLGNLYVADLGNNRIMRWLKDTKAGSIIVGENGQGDRSNQLYNPVAISFDRQGNLYVVDSGNHRVQKFDVNIN